MKIIRDVLNQELHDDFNIETGGIAFEGETVRDFAECCNISFDTSIEQFNIYLAECGIETI